MSKPKGFEKPAGVRDYLPHAVTKRAGLNVKCWHVWTAGDTGRL